MRKIILFLFSIILLASCSKEENNYLESQSSDKEISMKTYDSIVISQRELIADYCIESQDQNYTRALTENKSYCSLKNNLLPAAKNFLLKVGFTHKDMNEMFEGSIKTNEDQEDAAVALLMFATVLDYSNAQEQHQTRGDTFKDCFLEATGIAAGVAIVGNLTKGMMSKTILKTAVKRWLPRLAEGLLMVQV